MPNVTLVSACRDSESLIRPFVERIAHLAWPVAQVRVAICEGDSVDGTWARLAAWADVDRRVSLVQRHTGQPRYGSVVDANRFRVLAEVFNAALDLVNLAWSDYVLFVPFDIEYGPQLLRRLMAHQVDMVSPLTWMGGIFYDTWALTKGGSHWHNFDRAWADANLGRELIELDTVGGTCLMRVEVLRDGCRYTAEEVDRGLSRQAKARGYRLWVDPATSVYHP